MKGANLGGALGCFEKSKYGVFWESEDIFFSALRNTGSHIAMMRAEKTKCTIEGSLS